MKTNLKKTKIFCSRNWIILLLLLFTACQSEPAPYTPDIVTQVVPIEPTETTPPVTTKKVIAVTATRQSPETLVSSIVTPTPFPIPTLSLAEKKVLTSELYKTNGNCELPCWWGIVPGETEWQTAELLLNSIVTELYTSAESELDDRYSVDVYLPVPQELSSREELIQHYQIINGKVMLIDSEPSSKIYTVSEILNTYGRPVEVKIETYSSSHGEINKFSVALFYPDKGILVRYGPSADFIDDYVLGCVQMGSGSVVVWSPEQKLSFAEALNGTRGLGTFGEQYYKPLEDATEMNVEMFYQTFLDPDTETCIETPAELWMDR